MIHGRPLACRLRTSPAPHSNDTADAVASGLTGTPQALDRIERIVADRDIEVPFTINLAR